MPDERFEDHLRFPRGRGHVPAVSHSASAGSAACGDVVRIDLAVGGALVSNAGFDVTATCTGDEAAILMAQDGFDLLLGSERFDVLGLVEDEALLALPLVPVHPSCSLPGHDAAALAPDAPPHPFAALQALRGPKNRA